ncbi:hypothetical protein ABFS82_02G029200 [Erythranthe guttata]|uniref:B3 domain-containing protein Os11g0197600-like n=1 Tax=Erythranthe guttata TaxID=4155 RepID=UPI00064DA10C|nr:PREDICTED: B3 domain-containing protein Os11g0197600-like [Erythranthe guttata]|eukprot:XP_012836988.1 PREDICTED: B3 domain-containing protein Os11g0197600-like [Erythranthe guttata]
MLGKNEIGSPDRRPCFFKIMLPPNFTRLRIPHDFNEQLSDINSNQATLASRTCGNWEVELVKDDKGDIYFIRGWPEFVKHHSLVPLDILVFKYNGDSSFDVVIFDKNGTVRNYHHHQESASSFPSFEKKMQSSNIGSKSLVQIPKKFATAHLPHSKQRITLRNSDGVSSSASIIIFSRKYLAITGGWKEFSDFNSIKKGDICTFELIDQTTMQVHIFRK